MRKTGGKNNAINYHSWRSVRRFRGLLLCCLLAATSCQNLGCNTTKFGVSDLEKTGDVRAALAICYRAQKDNAASGGGNTRNCDSLQEEFVKWQRFQYCTDIYQTNRAHCLCQVFKICAPAKD